MNEKQLTIKREILARQRNFFSFSEGYICKITHGQWQNSIAFYNRNNVEIRDFAKSALGRKVSIPKEYNLTPTTIYVITKEDLAYIYSSKRTSHEEIMKM